MIRPKAVLFDLDDTLISRHEMFQTYSTLFVKDNFPDVGTSKQKELLDTLRRFDDNGNARRPEMFYRICEEVNIPMPPEQQLLHHWNTVFPQCMVVMDGMHELLARLRALGILIALVTNGDPELQNNKIDKAGIRQCFDTIVVSGEFPYEKPDKRIFLLALERLGVKAAESVFVGDNLINDIYGAQQVGIHDIWINCFHYTDLKGVKPSTEIKSLRTLMKMTEEWEPGQSA